MLERERERERERWRRGVRRRQEWITRRKMFHRFLSMNWWNVLTSTEGERAQPPLAASSASLHPIPLIPKGGNRPPNVRFTFSNKQHSHTMEGRAVIDYQLPSVWNG